ncbi:MAG: DUF4173 domain-containing protein [Lachnospiraceae bacterium]|nr:DUF4173 domain-containing protein [Lachnospiraceae bacterium]
MNNEILEKIPLKKLFILSIVYSILYTFCLYDNYSGITFPFFIVGTIGFFVYYMKIMGKPIKRFSYFYLTAIFLMGVDICITFNEVLAVFNRCFIFVLFFMLFLHNIYDDSTWDVSRYLTGICRFCLSAIGFIWQPFKDVASVLKRDREEEAKDENAVSNKSKVRGNIWYVLIGLAISIPLLCVILPLLLSSDIIFSNTMEDIFSFAWDLDVTILFMLIGVFFMAYAMIYRLTSRMNELDIPVADKRVHNPVIAITVNTVLLLVYLMYCVIQIVFLFMRNGQLPEGYTYTQYAHEGFFQLVFVCIINIVLVLICRKYSKDSLVLKIILCVISACTYIMIASSAYRMYLYIDAYKLTFLRIYVLWALLVMAVIMAGVIVYLFYPGMPFVKYVVVAFISLWIVFAYSNPDNTIAKYNIQYHDDDDYICRLSYDALPAIEEYGGEDFVCSYMTTYDTFSKKKLAKNKIKIREWNYSKWRAKNIVTTYDSWKTE